MLSSPSRGTTVASLALALTATALLTAPARAGQLQLPPTPPIAPPSPAQVVQPRGGAQPKPLVGTFGVGAGACSGRVSGSYFRMIQPGGSRSGPFVQNSDSSCSDTTYTPLRPGRAAGLVTGTFQPHPSPAFDGAGGGRADSITAPQLFFGVLFASATNDVDPQTGVRVAAPRLTVDAEGRLGGDLRAFAAAWNGQHFNQGAPKPDGSVPGITSVPTGSYDARSGGYTLEWTSQIVGGPFHNFTGLWHLTGRFAPRDGAAARRTPPPTRPAPRAAAPQTAVAAAQVRTGPVPPASPTGAALPLTGSPLPAPVPLIAFGLAVGAALLRRHRSAAADV